MCVRDTLKFPTHVTAAGIPLLLALYGDVHPDVGGFLERRHLNTVMQTEIPPQCAVTTGLLVALHHTAHGKNDVLDRVLEMDDHQWIKVPPNSSKEEQEAIIQKSKKFLSDRIRYILSKLTGANAKDRGRLVQRGQEIADISRCVNCLLRDPYVCMPNKRVLSRKNMSCESKIDGAGTHSFGDPLRSMGNEE
jgi:hypothetical protein